MAGLTYMQRRPSGIYEFRKRLPQELAGRQAPEHLHSRLSELINPKTGNFKQFLTISLKTTNHKAAMREDMRQAARVMDAFAVALKLIQSGAQSEITSASPTATMPSVEDIEAETYRELLEADEQERKAGDARRHMQSTSERSQWTLLEPVQFGSRGMQNSHLEVMSDEISLLAPDFRDALARYDPAIIQAELKDYFRRKQAAPDPSSDYYYEAGLAVLRGTVRAYEARASRQSGELIATPPPPVASAPAPASKGPKLSEVFAAWQAGSTARGGKKPAYKSAAEAERAVRYLTEWLGDIPVGDISKEKARAFRDALSRLPKGVSIKHRSLPLPRLIEVSVPGGDTIHAASVNKYLTLLGAILSSAEREGMLDAVPGFVNPFRNFSIIVDKRNDATRREHFASEHLSALFNTPVFRRNERPAGGAAEASYWLPLIALLSGARLAEISQLRIADLKQDPETGIWVLDIGTEGGRSIKTASSRREVPVHGELIRLGLLHYRAALLEAGHREGDSLWPAMKKEGKMATPRAWSKWFNRYIRVTAGITDESIVFHSFRHAFVRLCRDAGLDEEIRNALTGHTSSGNVGRSYGDGFGLKALHAAIEKIAPPPSLNAVPEWKANI